MLITKTIYDEIITIYNLFLYTQYKMADMTQGSLNEGFWNGEIERFGAPVLF